MNARSRERQARIEEAREGVHVQPDERVIEEQEPREPTDVHSRALAILRVERERYRELFENAPDAMLVTDPGGIIREANARAAELLGMDPRFVKGKPLLMYMDVAGTDPRPLLARQDRNVEAHVVVRGRRREPVPVHLRARRLDGGRRLLWTAREVPGDLPSAAGDLARALRDKDDLLARERARNEVLERDSRAKDRLLAVLSNGLRAPLNAVIGWTELLRRELLDQGRRDAALATIDRNARILLALIEELLDVSRITAGKMALEVRPLDLGALVRRTVESAALTAAERGIALACSIEASVVVVADPKRLALAIDNLLSNALKFTPSGGHVDVVVSRTGENAGVAVRDTGKGIAPSELTRVFDCHRQVDDRSGSSGLELGLFIVKQIAELHGGSVTVASEGPGAGSTFTFELPMSDRAEPASPSAHAMRAEHDLTGMRVLVVDDDADTRELLVTILADTGAHIASANTLDDARGMLSTWRPDALVIGIAMRGDDDGLELVRAAKAELGDDLVAVALGGFASERDASHAREAGFDVHLTKPLRSTELLSALSQARAT